MGSLGHEQISQTEHVHYGFKAKLERNGARGVHKLAKSVDKENDGDALLTEEERWIDATSIS